MLIHKAHKSICGEDKARKKLEFQLALGTCSPLILLALGNP